MSTEKLYSIARRVNTAFIFCVIILVCLAVVIFIFQSFRSPHVKHQPTNIVNASTDEKIELGSFQTIPGTTVLRASLMTGRDIIRYKGGSSIYNYLFYDTSDGSSRWLMPGNKTLFVSTIDLSEYSGNKGKSAAVVLYEIVDSDTNGDNELTAADRKTIAVSDPAGRRFTRILTGVQDINGHNVLENGRVLVLYTSDSVLKAAEIDIETHKLLRDAPLKPINP